MGRAFARHGTAESIMRIRELPNHTAAYVLTTIDAFAREPNGQLWIDREAECYLSGEAPLDVTIKVRLVSAPGGRDRYEASIHQNQAGMPNVATKPAGLFSSVTAVEFDRA
jgi:hypothetical protein